jgi:hypothetical protein
MAQSSHFLLAELVVQTVTLDKQGCRQSKSNPPLLLRLLNCVDAQRPELGTAEIEDLVQV